MNEGMITVAYIAASILFILALGGLSNQESARRGNIYGMVGMGIAILATVLGAQVTGYGTIIVCMVVGGAIGVFLAKRVEMTQMPELVAILHSFVGLAAVLVGYASYLEPPAELIGELDAIHAEIRERLGKLLKMMEGCA